MDDRWVWDFWLARGDDGLWHCYFLQADKSLGIPDLRHFNVSQGHATSHDLRNWVHHGTCFRPSQAPAWDDYTTWTGSVLKGPDGNWHYFYTGTCRSELGLKQRIGHALGRDMHNWQRVGDGLALDLDPDLYEEYSPGIWHDRAWRDPWVMPHPSGSGWLMAFTGRINGATDPNVGGAVGLAVSEDLFSWTAIEPLYSGVFGQLEVPQIIRMSGRWYCLFCVGPEHWSDGARSKFGDFRSRGTHYLMAEDFAGPWRLAPGPFLTSACDTEIYAAKVVFVDGKTVLLGFLHDGPDSSFLGRISDPMEVVTDAAGYLSLRP